MIKLKASKVIMNGEVNEILPSSLPDSPTEGTICIDKSDKKLKIYSGNKWKSIDESKNHNFDNSTNGFTSTDTQSAIEELRGSLTNESKETHIFNIHKLSIGNNLMTNATWFDTWPSQYSSGSYSGYASGCKPIIMPCNCLLKSATIIFRKAYYDWRSTSGSIYIELGFYNLVYNGSSDYCRIVFELSGSFTNGSSDTGTYTYDKSIFTMRVGENVFLKNSMIGIQLRKDVSAAGQISSIADPLIMLRFEEI